MRTLRRQPTAVWVLLALLLAFHLWFAAQIPYGVDDWTWGGTPGIPRLLSGELNNRFAGNLTEILVARSPLLKTLVMGLVFTLIPAEAAALALEADRKERSGAPALLLICLGEALMLSIPREVWAQSYSWVAGFSNFVVSGLLLCLYHRLLLRQLQEREPFARGWWVPALLFVFGAVMQLYLENVAIYTVLLAGFLLIWRLVRREGLSAGILALMLGNLAGLVLMFSNKIFVILLQEGELFNGYRALTFSMDDGLVSILLGFVRRFLGDLSNKIWGNNWIMCSLVVLLLSFFALRRKKPGFAAGNLLYLVYFVASHFHGPFPLPAFSPVHYLSGIAEPAFFLYVGWQLLAFWKDRPQMRGLLLVGWCLPPLLILPLLPVTSAGPRCYATEAVLLMQFCLLLALQLWDELEEKPRRIAAGLCAAALLGLCVNLGVVYAQIGQVKRARDAQLELARTGQLQTVHLAPYPHADYLWITDGKGPAYEGIWEVIDFYQLPEGVELIYDRPEQES